MKGGGGWWAEGEGFPNFTPISFTLYPQAQRMETEKDQRGGEAEPVTV